MLKSFTFVLLAIGLVSCKTVEKEPANARILGASTAENEGSFFCSVSTELSAQLRQVGMESNQSFALAREISSFSSTEHELRQCPDYFRQLSFFKTDAETRRIDVDEISKLKLCLKSAGGTTVRAIGKRPKETYQNFLKRAHRELNEYVDNHSGDVFCGRELKLAAQ